MPVICYVLYVLYPLREKKGADQEIINRSSLFQKDIVFNILILYIQFNRNVSSFWASCWALVYLRLSAFTELLSHPYTIHCIGFMVHKQTFRASQLPYTNDVISVCIHTSPSPQLGISYLLALSWPALPQGTQQLLCAPVYCSLEPCFWSPSLGQSS